MNLNYEDESTDKGYCLQPFQKSRRSFPSEVHRVIHVMALRQTPLSVSLAGTDISEDMKESCKAYHEFVHALLADMFENPLAYGLKAGELENFLGGKKINGMKQKFPSKTKSLLSVTHNSLCNLRFLEQLALAGEVVEDNLVLSPEAYQGIRTVFDRSLTPKKKTIMNEVPYDTLLGSLERVGFVINDSDSRVTIASLKFPKMFPAMVELAKSVHTVKTFGNEGFFHCEFRQMFNKHTPDYHDVLQPLDENNYNMANLLHEYLLSRGAKPSCTTYWKINYHYKGEHVMLISTNGNELEVRITGVYGWNDKSLMNSRLEARDNDFQAYALRHLNYCTACSTSHLGGFITVLGKNKRVCGGGGIAFKIKNPTKADIQYIKDLADMRMDILLHKPHQAKA